MASATQDLESFVRDALAQGTPRETIASTLTDAGWSQAQVQRALNAWADVPFPVPVPRPRASLSAREAFFYLLMFAALYMAAWHVCDLLFTIINHAMPDATDHVVLGQQCRLDAVVGGFVADRVSGVPLDGADRRAARPRAIRSRACRPCGAG